MYSIWGTGQKVWSELKELEKEKAEIDKKVDNYLKELKYS